MDKFKKFPQISALIDDECLKDKPLFLRTHFAKAVVAEFKASDDKNLAVDKAFLVGEIKKRIDEFKSKDFQPLINATGVVIHTNLGRSVLDESAFDECKSLACGYFNLEFDLNTGKKASDTAFCSKS